jgi:TPR repeat protein
MLYSAQKLRELEDLKARLKVYTLLKACSICGDKAKLICGPCRTTAYCSKDCLIIDWRDRGHRKACEKIRDERAADAARAESPTPPPSPPPEVFYGPARRSDADAARARIAAEFEAARARREAEPEPEPVARDGPRCPICYEEWDVNVEPEFRVCCCRKVCASCEERIGDGPCALCRAPEFPTEAAALAQLRRHVENDVPEATFMMAKILHHGLVASVSKNAKKAVKLYQRAVDLGNVDAMLALGRLYEVGDGPRRPVKLDQERAVRLYRMAAEQGGAAARGHLACALIAMKDFSRNEAIHLLHLSADGKWTPAYNMIGMCYLWARGVEVNLKKAKRWIKRGIAAGCKQAPRTMKAVMHAKTMDPEERAKIVANFDGLGLNLSLLDV